MGKIVGFVLLFAFIGLIVGYVIYGKVGNDYIDPLQFFVKRKGLIGYGVNRVYGMEKRKEGILVAGAIGAALGLFIGLISTGKKEEV